MPDVIATWFLVPGKGTTPEEATRWIVEGETTGTATGISTRMEYVRRRDGEVLSTMRQAMDAGMEGLTLEEYANDHDGLAHALAGWGVVHA